MAIEYATVTSAVKGDEPINRSVTGYGSKLPTCYRVQVDGGRRWYRVYCICHSNVGSLYILPGGERRFIHDYEIDDVLEGESR